ncbi:DegT/DnrJ/EryC1/StrS family aminotransferase [bacterium]|nr:MAG: DegT/DnrJ/EryC1/StrS family aminotransferase [bacterium]
MKKYKFSLQYPKPIDEEESKVLKELVLSGNLSRYTSSITDELEQSMAEFFGTKFAVTCSSGTGAIHSALIALDLPVGSEVITTPVTDIGVVLPIIYQNLIPVFADLDDTTFNFDPESVAEKITPKTSAIIAVHLGGNPCALDELTRIAARHNVALIEDCSQAHGAEYKGRRVGSFGKVGIASLQQSKHISSGEGGVIFTDDSDLNERIKLSVDKGWTRYKGLHDRRYEFLSLNYRYTGIQAAVVLPQLKRVSRILNKKRRLADFLYERLKPYSEFVRCHRVLEGAKHSYYSFATYVTKDERFRDELLACLAKDFGVECAYGYANPVPLYLCAAALEDPKKFGRQLMYTQRSYPRGTCPKAEDLLSRSFLLPFNEMFDEEDMEEMANRLGKALEYILLRGRMGTI